MSILREIVERNNRKEKVKDSELIEDERLSIIKEYVECRYEEAIERCELKFTDYEMEEAKNKLIKRILKMKESNKKLTNKSLIDGIPMDTEKLGRFEKLTKGVMLINLEKELLLKEKKKLYNDLELFNFIVLELEKKYTDKEKNQWKL